MTERVMSGAPPASTSGRAPHAASPTASSLRREILVHLRRNGPTSPDGLAAALGASRTGVLQQLHALESANLVQHALERHGVGRPRHLYDVTADAQDLFPEDYDGLASGLLTAIASIGGDELIEQVFAARRQQIGARVKREMDDILPPGATLTERVMLLASIQDRAGYLADAHPEEGGLRLVERNCAIHHVAKTQPAACAAELALFREVLDAEVVRESHIASGERCCSYKISARPD